MFNAKASNLTQKDEHAFHHGCTIDDAKKYINGAKCSIVRKRWDGLSINFYATDGAAYLEYESGLVKTIFLSEKFDDDTKAIMEVLK